jgi:hypothetical protein
MGVSRFESSVIARESFRGNGRTIRAKPLGNRFRRVKDRSGRVTHNGVPQTAPQPRHPR